MFVQIGKLGKVFAVDHSVSHGDRVDGLRFHVELPCVPNS
jgi:hypothetical protein